MRSIENVYRNDVTVARIVFAIQKKLKERHGIDSEVHLGGSGSSHAYDPSWQRGSPNDMDLIFVVRTHKTTEELRTAIDEAVTSALYEVYNEQYLADIKAGNEPTQPEVHIPHVSDWRGDNKALRRVRIGISGEHCDLRVLDARCSTEAPYDFTINAGIIRFKDVLGANKLKLEALPGVSPETIIKHRSEGLAVLTHALRDDGLLRLWKTMTQGYVPVASPFMDALLPTNLHALQHPNLKPGEEDTIGPALRRVHFVTKARESVVTHGAGLALLANAILQMQRTDVHADGATELLHILKATLDSRMGNTLDPPTRALLALFKGSETDGLDVLDLWLHLCATSDVGSFDASATYPHTRVTRVMAGEQPWHRTFVAGLNAYILTPGNPHRAVSHLAAMPSVVRMLTAPMKESFVEALGLDKHLRHAWASMLGEDFWNDSKARQEFGEKLTDLYTTAPANALGFRTRLLLAAVKIQPEKNFSPYLLALAQDMVPGADRDALIALAKTHRSRELADALDALKHPISATRVAWKRCIAIVRDETDAAVKARMAHDVWEAFARGKLNVLATTHVQLNGLLQVLTRQPSAGQAEKIADVWLQLADSKVTSTKALAHTLRTSLHTYLSSVQDDFPLHGAVDMLTPDALVRRLAEGDLDVSKVSLKRLSKVVLEASTGVLVDNLPATVKILGCLGEKGAIPSKLFDDGSRAKSLIRQPALLVPMGKGLSEVHASDGLVKEWVKRASSQSTRIQSFFGDLDPDNSMYLPAAQALCASLNDIGELAAHMQSVWTTYRERYPEAGARIAEVLLHGLRRIKDEDFHTLLANGGLPHETLQQWYSALQHVPVAARVEATRLLATLFLMHDDIPRLQEAIWEFVPLLKHGAVRNTMRDLFMACVDKLLDREGGRAPDVRAATALFEQTPKPRRKDEFTYQALQARLFIAQLQAAMEHEAVGCVSRIYNKGHDVTVAEKHIGALFRQLPLEIRERISTTAVNVVLGAATSTRGSAVRLASQFVSSDAPKDCLTWLLALRSYCGRQPVSQLVTGLENALANADARADFEARIDAIYAQGGPFALNFDTPLAALLRAYLRHDSPDWDLRVARAKTWLGQVPGEPLTSALQADLSLRAATLGTLARVAPRLWQREGAADKRRQLSWLCKELVNLDDTGGHLQYLCNNVTDIPDAKRLIGGALLNRMLEATRTNIAEAQEICMRTVFFLTTTMASDDPALAEKMLVLLAKNVAPFSEAVKTQVAHWVDNSLGYFASVDKIQGALHAAGLDVLAQQPYPLHATRVDSLSWMADAHLIAMEDAQGDAFDAEFRRFQAIGAPLYNFSNETVDRYWSMFAAKLRDSDYRERVRLMLEETIDEKGKSAGPEGQLRIANILLFATRAVGPLTPAEFSTYLRLCAARWHTDPERDLCKNIASLAIGAAHPHAFEPDSAEYARVVQRFEGLAASKSPGHKAWANDVLNQLRAASSGII